MPEIKQRKMEAPSSEKERIKRKRKEENKKRRRKKEEEKLLAKLKKKEKQEKEVAEKPKGPKEPDHPPPSHKQSAASSRDTWGRWSQEEWDKWNAEKKGQHWKQKSWRYWTGYIQPKEESQDSEEEEEKEAEESSKRPRIAFGDRRLKNLNLKRGRMGPDSSGDEHQELLQVEEGELQAEAAEEEEPHGVGELTRFDGSAPKPFPPSRNGPTGKEWTRVDLIVDSGASDSTLPLGVLPGVKDRFSKAMFTHLLPSKGIKHFYPEAAFLRDIRFLGYAQLTSKSDQEPAIWALTNAVKNTLSARGVTCRLENSPKGDAHGMSNGDRDLQEHWRIMWSSKSRRWSTPNHHCYHGWWSAVVFFKKNLLMRSPRMVWHRSGNWKGEIGSSLFHDLENVLITGYVHNTNWKQGGTLVFIWVLDCIRLRRSLEPHNESLWYKLLGANRQINSGMQTWMRSPCVVHGRQVRESRRTIRKL